MKYPELHCPKCGHRTPLTSKFPYLCPQCGSNQEILYDYEEIKQKWPRESLQTNNNFSLWRYAELYPTQKTIEGIPIGWTPCFPNERLARLCGVEELWLKEEGRNPSASFKDRASAIALQWALENGHTVIAAASTGNAGAATALMGAVLGLTTRIFIPHTAPQAKVAQLLAFGAEVIMVEGSYDQAFELCAQASEKFGWFNRNTGFNPLTREGKKSASFEIAEQMNWNIPDLIVVPVGDGNIISGIWKGFVELKKIGWIDRLPKLLAAQSTKSDAVTQAFEGRSTIPTIQAHTIADSISVDHPRDGEAAVRAIQESQGFAITVEDQEILNAIPIIARNTGVLVEPAAATSLAALFKARELGKIQSNWRVLLLLTGHGLKDIAAIQKVTEFPQPIAPDLTSLQEKLNL